jgi:hypothetical protein
MAKPIVQADLAKLVAKAVEIARQRHQKVELTPGIFEQDTHRIPWWIVGRVTRAVDLDAAHKIAEEITEGVSKDPRGPELQPVTLRVGKDILVGFIEKYQGQIEPPMGGAFFGPSGQ